MDDTAVLAYVCGHMVEGHKIIFENHEPLIAGGMGGSATSFDNFMNAEQAVEFGICDRIITNIFEEV